MLMARLAGKDRGIITAKRARKGWWVRLYVKDENAGFAATQSPRPRPCMAD